MDQETIQFFINNKELFILAALWSIPWKGVALWKAARKNDARWFVALLLINTLGLLEAAYIFHWSGRNAKPRTPH